MHLIWLHQTTVNGVSLNLLTMKNQHTFQVNVHYTIYFTLLNCYQQLIYEEAVITRKSNLGAFCRGVGVSTLDMEKLIRGYPNLTRKLFLPGICLVSADMLICLFESSNISHKVTFYRRFFHCVIYSREYKLLHYLKFILIWEVTLYLPHCFDILQGCLQFHQQLLHLALPVMKKIKKCKKVWMEKK